MQIGAGCRNKKVREGSRTFYYAEIDGGQSMVARILRTPAEEEPSLSRVKWCS